MQNINILLLTIIAYIGYLLYNHKTTTLNKNVEKFNQNDIPCENKVDNLLNEIW